MSKIKTQNGAGYKALTEAKDTRHPDARRHYLGFPTTNWDLSNMGELRHQIHASILHEHGVVDRFRATVPGFALPMVHGRPIGKNTHVEAADALLNFRPTGSHLETDDGMDDTYVWSRRGEDAPLEIIRESKIRSVHYVGFEAFAVKHYPEYFERKKMGLNNNEYETVSEVHAAEQCLTTRTQHEIINPPPSSALSSHVVVPSKSKSTKKNRSSTDAEDAGIFKRARLARKAGQAKAGSNQRAAADDAGEPPKARTRHPMIPPTGVFTDVRPWPTTIEESRRETSSYTSVGEQVKVDDRVLRLDIISQLKGGALGPRNIFPRGHPEETEEHALARIRKAKGDAIKSLIAPETEDTTESADANDVADQTQMMGVMEGAERWARATSGVQPSKGTIPKFHADATVKSGLQQDQSARESTVKKSGSKPMGGTKELISGTKLASRRQLQAQTEAFAIHGSHTAATPLQQQKKGRAPRKTRMIRNEAEGGSGKALRNGAEKEATPASPARNTRLRAPTGDVKDGDAGSGSLSADAEGDSAAAPSSEVQEKSFPLKLKKYNPTPSETTSPAIAAPAAAQVSSNTEDSSPLPWSLQEKKHLFKSYLRTADISKTHKELNIFIWSENLAAERDGRARVPLKSSGECEKMMKELLDAGWTMGDE